MDDRGFGWDRYVAWLVEREGTLTAVADVLAAERGHAENVGSIERALRRLRANGTQDGGKWGARALRRYGLPEAVDARLRWMGTYHSRFTDLPVSVCEDLVRTWDHPPVSAQRGARAWLLLARVTVAIRRRERAEMGRLLADAGLAGELPPEVVAEAALARAWLASRDDLERVPEHLAVAEAALAEVEDPWERACLHARWVDHQGYEWNHVRRGRPPDAAAALAWYLQIPEDGPPFARARRANGIAFCRWKLGDAEGGVQSALAAAEHAGDGGHVRLRAMALAMVARIDPQRADARARAEAIASQLDDELLAHRFARARASDRGSTG